MSSLEEVFEDGYDSGGEMGHLYNAVEVEGHHFFMILSLEQRYHNNKKNKT